MLNIAQTIQYIYKFLCKIFFKLKKKNTTEVFVSEETEENVKKMENVGFVTTLFMKNQTIHLETNVI